MLWVGKLLLWKLSASGTALWGVCGWWKRHAGVGDGARSPPGMTMPLPGSSWARDCAWCLPAQRSPAPWTRVCFSSYCCCCCWENSNHFGVSSLIDTFLRSCLGAQNSITDLNVDHCTSLNKVHLTINLGGLPQVNELPAFLGVPDMCGDQKKAEKREIFEESPCYQMLQWQMFAKSFPRGWNEGLILRTDLQLFVATEMSDIGKEKVLVFPE